MARRSAERKEQVWLGLGGERHCPADRNVALVADLAASNHYIQRAWPGLTGAPDLLWRLLSAIPGRWLLVINNADDAWLLGRATSRPRGSGSRAQFAALLPVRERVLGADHPDTADTRRELTEPWS
ncbi:hypothetical protein O7634_21530 [Micromonospora sp. WMMD1120]|uniref:hypothetical protein n=1 Tax=Micromonospora sp. WMMD1120 TaxID=3016106 RepID=UPI002416CB97|nr:hypothetical protein [Micromonospora sp. WMMD1120]MDG4809335.1 hypothetical protein [Micromonospora sp. WMMD1120]